MKKELGTGMPVYKLALWEGQARFPTGQIQFLIGHPGMGKGMV